MGLLSRIRGDGAEKGRRARESSTSRFGECRLDDLILLGPTDLMHHTPG